VKFVRDKNEALKLQSENTCISYLFRFEEDVVGYVTLAMGSLKRADLPADVRPLHHFSRVPCLLLGQMARDIRFKGEGIGGLMFDWVLSKADELSHEIGCRYVILEAEQDRKSHYEKYFSLKPLPQRQGSKTTVMYFNLGLRNNSKP
jgi:hypothetical protein